MFKKRPPAEPPEQPAEAKAGLISTRTLVIIVLSIGVGLIMGPGAGLTAGVMAQGAGPVVATAIGWFVGLGTAVTSGLTAATMLHQVVDNKHG